MPHMNTEQVNKIAQLVNTIAETMPQGHENAEGAARSASSANTGSEVGKALSAAMQAFGTQYKTLTRQVDGFPSDLSAAAKSWHSTDDVNADSFKGYGAGRGD